MAVRVMTYNTHGCVGLDRRLDVERIARVIEAANADIVALQELDVGRSRSRGDDQPARLAEHLGMRLDFCSARECDGGHYGNAILSRFAITPVRQGCLPRLGKHSEARAVQWVTLDTPLGRLNLLNTHLGLRPRERLAQAAELAGESWLLDPRCGSNTVLCGDLNALPGSAVVRTLRARLHDAGFAPLYMPKTFPAPLPLLCLDYVLVSPGVRVAACDVARSPLARVASDHLPVVVDLEIGGGSAGETPCPS